MKAIIFILAVAGLLLVVLVAYIISKRHAKPMTNLEDKMKPHVNIAVLGSPGAPRVELSAAMIRVASELGGGDPAHPRSVLPRPVLPGDGRQVREGIAGATRVTAEWMGGGVVPVWVAVATKKPKVIKASNVMVAVDK